MKEFITKLLVRILFYGVLFCWFYFIVPILWDHGSSWALEFMFGFSVLFSICIFYLEVFLKRNTNINK